MLATDKSQTECLLCHKRFWRITNTHLNKAHNITSEDYKKRFPSALFEDIRITSNRSQHIKGKTYTDIYGAEKAIKLKELRRMNAIEQMKDGNQIKIRQKKCGIEWTKEQKEKMSESKLLKHIQKECIICSKVFLGSYSQKYCSYTCQHQGNYERIITDKCKYCGNNFEKTVYSEKEHCSSFCREKAVGDRLSKVCILCGADFEVPLYKKDSKFCSSKCYLTYKKKNALSMSSARKLAIIEKGERCERCGATDNIVVHHIDGKGHQCEVGNHDITNLIILCRKCHAKLHKELEKTENLFKGQKDIENGMALILKGLKQQYNIDLTDENYKDTPIRVARAYMEMMAGLKESPEDILSTKFIVENYDGMIIWTNLKFYSICSHHFLPFEGHCNIVVLPINNQVIGISKIARLVDCFAKRPQLQERMTHEIAESITKYLTPDCMVVTTATHMCMQCRGVEQENSPLTVSAIRGKFEKIEVRTEALALMNNGGKE